MSHSGHTRAGLVLGAILALAPIASAQDASLQGVLSSISPPANAAPLAAMPEAARSAIDNARAALQNGEFRRAWDELRVASALLENGHPQLFSLGAEIAHAENDRFRGAMLLRRALLLDPLDTDNRNSLALLLAHGAPGTPDDLWVLAGTLDDNRTAITDRARALMLRTLAHLLEEAGRPDDASTVFEAAASYAQHAGVPALLGEPTRAAQREALGLSLEAALEGVRQDPLALDTLVTEMLRNTTDTDALLEQTEALEPGPEAVAIRAYLYCELGRARKGDGLVRSRLVEDPAHPALLAARARTLHLIGDYALLRSVGGSLETDTAQRLELGALLLWAGADYERAAERALMALQNTDETQEPVFVRRSMLAARIAQDAGDLRVASTLLMRTHRAVPEASEPLRALVMLHAPKGPEPSVELYAMASSRLLALADEPHDAGVLRASEALRRGYADIAEGLLMDLAQERLDDPLPVRALVDLWLETDRSARAEAWLEARLEHRPALSHLRALLAEVHIQRNRLRRAISTLEFWYDDNPGDLLIATELERVYAEHARSPEQVETLALRRLRRFPDSIDRLKDRALILARLGDPDDLSKELDLLLPHAERTGVDLGPWSVELFRRLFREAASRRPGEADVTPVIIRLHAGIPTTPFEADELAIRALASAHPDINAVLDATRRAMARHTERAPELALIGATELFSDAQTVADIVNREERDSERAQAVRMERYDASMNLAARAVVESNSVSPPGYDTPEARMSATAMGRSLDLISGLARPGLELSPGEHGRDIVDTLLNLQDPMPALYAKLTSNFLVNEDVRNNVDIEIVALEAHALSYAFNDKDVPQDVARADALSRLGLRISPKSASINNDLGYRYAERGERLDEARAMTLLAYKQTPTNHSFIDSHAWVLYKLGVLEDAQQQRGAIDLLREAYRFASAAGATTSAPVIGDHLGDALWAAGRGEEALDAWARALPLTERLLQQQGVAPGQARDEFPRSTREYIDLRDALRAKIDAAGVGDEPPIAPPHGPGFTPPIPGEQDPGEAAGP